MAAPSPRQLSKIRAVRKRPVFPHLDSYNSFIITIKEYPRVVPLQIVGTRPPTPTRTVDEALAGLIRIL